MMYDAKIITIARQKNALFRTCLRKINATINSSTKKDSRLIIRNSQEIVVGMVNKNEINKRSSILEKSTIDSLEKIFLRMTKLVPNNAIPIE
jgi:hypothetical protein